MNDHNKDDDMTLDAVFNAARAAPPQVPDALMARVLADAEMLQPAAPRSGWRRGLAGLGGVPGLGGLITASCVGFWLGVAPPEGLPDVAGLIIGGEVDIQDEGESAGLTGFGWDIGEG